MSGSRCIRCGAHALVLLIVGLAGGCSQPGATPEAVAGGDPERGRERIAEYGCGGCHMVPGVPGASGAVGPSLAGVADREFIAGHMRNEPPQLIRWIRFPQEIHHGSAMPTLGVSEGDAADIAAYLYTLRAGGLGPPRLIPPSALPRH